MNQFSGLPSSFSKEKKKEDSYDPYVAGKKRYGSGLRNAPSMGNVDPTGYKERELKVRARKKALQSYAQKDVTKQYANPAWLGYFGRR